jgi:transposase
MTTTATCHVQENTTAGTLFVAFELSEKTWKLGFTTGHGQKPRERTVPARHQERVLEEIAHAKRRLGLPDTAPVISCYEAGREGFWLHGFYRRTGSRTRWWIPLPSRSTVAVVEPRAMGWTCASC